MVGVPKSNRCSYCKKRKVKCDEKWPTCGTCSRARKVCSGARLNMKFVHNGRHTKECPTPSTDLEHDQQPVEELFAQNTPHCALLIDDRQYEVAAGSFHRMRFSRPKLRSLPMTPTARLVSKFVFCLEDAQETGYDLRILGHSLELVPKHLEMENVAVRHAAELLIHCWTNSRRDVPQAAWLNLRLYSRALRSLQRAIEDPDSDMLTNTLAAQTILQRVETSYDFSRGSNQENHAAGMIAVITNGGPTQPISELALHLVFENYYVMLQDDVKKGKESPFNQLEWVEALEKVVDTYNIRPTLKATYRMWIKMAIWPTVVKLTRTVCWNPMDSIASAELLLRAKEMVDFLEEMDLSDLKALRKSGDIVGVQGGFPQPDMVSSTYKFKDYETTKLFSFHAMFAIMAYRGLQVAYSSMGLPDPGLEERAWHYSERVWMSWPTIRDYRPLDIECLGPLVISWEAGLFEWRDFGCTVLEDMDEFRSPRAIGYWCNETCLANIRAFTGRLPFIKSQDINIELKGIGCRC